MEHDTRWRSQLGQDRFAWLTLDRKRDGTFIDIGAGEPETISNTWTLETGFGWRGVLCDIEHAEQLRKLRNPSNDVEADAFAVDWRAHFRKWQRDGWIDFLSLDIEPPDMTAKLLLDLPLGEVKFRIACVEHDAYRGAGGNLRRDAMRNLLEWHGYIRVCDVGCEVDGKHAHIEDWWVHSDAEDLVERAQLVLTGGGAI